MTRQEERNREYAKDGFFFVTNFKVTDLELIVICCRGAEAGFSIEKDAYDTDDKIITDNFALYVKTEKERDVIDLFWQYHHLVPKQMGMLVRPHEIQIHPQTQPQNKPSKVVIGADTLDVKI